MHRATVSSAAPWLGLRRNSNSSPRHAASQSRVCSRPELASWPGQHRCASGSAAAETARLSDEPSAERLQSQLSSVVSAVVTDATVPEGHAGLHSALYGTGTSDSADVHVSRHSYRAVEGEDDGTAVLPVSTWLDSREGVAVPGVYAVFDEAGQLQLISFSRNVVTSLRGHLVAVGPQRCCSVRVLVFANKAMATRAAMETEAHAWLTAAGSTPPGNGPEASLWGASQAVMSPAEREQYEERKLKLQRAMGAKAAGDDGSTSDANDSAEERRRKMKLALEAGDWSEVIDGQTKETLAAPGGYIASPFTRPDVHRAVGDKPTGVEMTVDSVDAVLNEVRPYLIADGGDVSVVSVSPEGVVALRLQGACGTCPSSSATMSMGIERALRSAFGDALKAVIQAPSEELAAGTVALPREGQATDVEAVRQLLNSTVGAAITAMGGTVRVQSVEAGVVVLSYKGPAALGKGIAAAVKDKFADIRDVRLDTLID